MLTTLQKKLELEIKNFLAVVARWDPQWFNKPKFHILLHLVAHIRRFGLNCVRFPDPFHSVCLPEPIISPSGPNRSVRGCHRQRALTYKQRIRNMTRKGFTSTVAHTNKNQTTKSILMFHVVNLKIQNVHSIPRPFPTGPRLRLTSTLIHNGFCTSKSPQITLTLFLNPLSWFLHKKRRSLEPCLHLG